MTNLYYESLGDFMASMAASQLSEASVALKRGLTAMQRITITALSIPFIEAKGGAIAALFDTDETLQLMLSTKNPGIGERVAVYREDAAAVGRVRDHLKAGTDATRLDLRRFAKPGGARTLSRLIDYMIKSGELVSIGKAPEPRYVLAESLSPGQRSDQSAAALSGGSAAPVERLSLDLHARLREQTWWLRPERPPMEAPVLPRPEFFHWEVTKGPAFGEVQLKDDKGRDIRNFVLSHGVAKIFESPYRDYVIIVDTFGDLWVYSRDGHLVVSLSLGDIRAISEVNSPRWPMRGRNAVLSADISPDATELSVAVIGMLWRIRLDGKVLRVYTLPVASEEVPEGFESSERARTPTQLEVLDSLGIPRSASPGALAEALTNHGVHLADRTYSFPDQISNAQRVQFEHVRVIVGDRTEERIRGITYLGEGDGLAIYAESGAVFEVQLHDRART